MKPSRSKYRNDRTYKSQTDEDKPNLPGLRWKDLLCIVDPENVYASNEKRRSPEIHSECQLENTNVLARFIPK
jgi:hypothetical protein